jgi:hypothetical protein
MELAINVFALFITPQFKVRIICVSQLSVESNSINPDIREYSVHKNVD